MNPTVLAPAPAAGDAAAPPRSSLRAALPAPLAQRVVGYALLLGIAGDALFVGPGVGLALFVALTALALVSLAWAAGRDVPAPARRWLGAAVLFAVLTVWRDGEQLLAFDCLATVFSLGMAALALRDPDAGLLAARLRDTLAGAAAVVRATAAGIVPTAVAQLFAPGPLGRVRSGARPVVRAALIATALLLVFGSLLRSADPIFASLVSLPDVDVESVVRHGFVIGIFAWLTGGWAIGALAEAAPVRPAARLPFELGTLDVTTALGTLNALFGAFVLAQLGWLFGGEAFLRARTGLTAAEYARGGFFQMLWVVVLVLPLLVATRAALAPGRALARRHTMLALPVVALLGAIVCSAGWRMRMYVHYYGLTLDRFYPLVFMGWLTLVLVWLAATVLRDRGRPFVAGAVISALLTLAGLNVAAPDAIVARVNVARAWRPATGDTPTLDVAHLARLSGEAAGIATTAVLAPSSGSPGSALRKSSDEARCEGARRLLDHWGSLEWRPSHVTESSLEAAERADDWRYWNAGASGARQVVDRHAAALRRVMFESCSR